MTKVTKKDALQYVLAHYDVPTEYAEKIEGMIAQLEKKATTERKPSKAQRESAERGAQVAEFMASVVEPMTAGDIAKAVFGEDATASKVTAHLTKLVKNGAVIRTEEKGKAYFRTAE